MTFTKALQRHVDCPPAEVPGPTVRDALAAYFEQQPQARHYVLDEQGCLRKHIAVFVDGVMLRDRGLGDPLAPSSELHVMQALSGGSG